MKTYLSHNLNRTSYNHALYLNYFAMPLVLVHENMNFVQVMLPEAVAIVAAPTDPTR